MEDATSKKKIQTAWHPTQHQRNEGYEKVPVIFTKLSIAVVTKLVYLLSHTPSAYRTVEITMGDQHRK